MCYEQVSFLHRAATRRSGETKLFLYNQITTNVVWLKLFVLTHRCCHGEIKRGELCLLAQSTTPRRIQVVFSHSTDPTPTPTFECCIRVRRVIFYSSHLSSVRQRNIYNIKWLRYVWSAHTLNRRSCCEMNAVDLWSPWTGSLPNRKDRLFWPSSGSKWVPQFKNFQFIFFFLVIVVVLFSSFDQPVDPSFTD